jgi:hypothetical protein
MQMPISQTDDISAYAKLLKFLRIQISMKIFTHKAKKKITVELYCRYQKNFANDIDKLFIPIKPDTTRPLFENTFSVHKNEQI